MLYDVHPDFLFRPNKRITDVTQNQFCLIAEHSGFMKHTSNKLNAFFLMACFFPDEGAENMEISLQLKERELADLNKLLGLKENMAPWRVVNWSRKGL